MKKIIAFLLIISFTISLVACGGKDGTELTLDNYSDYLDVSVVLNTTGSITEYRGVTGYELFKANVNVEGVSGNFIYNDVVVEIKVTCKCIEDLSAEEIITLTVETNVSGDGSASELGSFDSNVPFTQDSLRMMSSYEVVSVKGNVVNN